MKRVAETVVLALSSAFFLTYPLVSWSRKRGYRLTGAGLVGTAAGLLSVRLLPDDPLRCLFVLTAVLFISVAISDVAEHLLGQKDDQRIVIDEWAGYLASVAFLPKTPMVLCLGFVLFRIVDVTKPLGVRRLGYWPGGWGVVMDDFAGGLMVNVILHLLSLF